MITNDRPARQQVWFLILSAFLTAALTAVVVLGKYQQSRQDAVRKLEEAKINLGRMKEVAAETNRTLATVRALLPPGFTAQSSEWLAFSRIDEIKARMAGSDLRVSSIGEEAGEERLPFAIKSVDADYAGLLNNIGHLESSAFPFVVFKSIAITGEDGQGKAAVSYALDGTVQTPQTVPGIPEDSR